MKRLRWTVVAAILASLLGPTRAHAATFHVALTGTDSNTGGVADPFRTIQRAIDAAAAGADGQDVINVEAGTYATPLLDVAITIPASASISRLVLRGGFVVGSFTIRVPRTTVYVPQSPGAIAIADVDVFDSDVAIDGSPSSSTARRALGAFVRAPASSRGGRDWS